MRGGIQVALLGLVAVGAGLASRAESYQVDADSLNTWWNYSAQMWLGETAYHADHVQFQDGMCSYDLAEGVIVPVYTGQPPVTERVVGMVFVGEGTLSVDFPENADALAFANHMVMRQGQEADEYRGVAEGQPWETRITRGMILSADPDVEQQLFGLEPVGAGVMQTVTADGVDEEYVVTETRGRLKARVMGTNILSNRRNQLVKVGLDPLAMLRQDRLLHEELGFPGKTLRLLADFRTDTHLGVAAGDGRGVGVNDHDQWVTCFRDGLGYADTGFRHMAFAHGTDGDGRHRFQRMSGSVFPDREGEDIPRPAVRMDPVHADVNVKVWPGRMSRYQQVEVDSLLTVRPEGHGQRHLALRLPSGGALPGSFEILELSMEDGTAIPWVGLQADLMRHGGAASDLASSEGETDLDTSGLGEADLSTAEPVTLGGGTSDASEDVEASSSDSDEVALDGVTQSLDSMLSTTTGEAEGLLVQHTPQRYEILALLPRVIPVGEEVKVRLKWKARWNYANWSDQGRALGATTGRQAILPDLLPSLGGSAWSFTIEAGHPGSGLRILDLAVAGDTEDEWEDPEEWRWVRTRGTGAIEASVAAGRWYQLVDPPAQGMPKIRVHMFTTEARALPEFPPEARRVLVFLDRFLPSYPQSEVEIFQDAATFVSTGLSRGFRDASFGLVGMQTVKVSDVGAATPLEKENPHLTQTMIARQLAHQYWGQSMAPASTRDAWISDALADSYAAFYIRSAFGGEAFEDRLDGVRELIEDPVERRATEDQVNDGSRFLSLTGSTQHSDVSDKVMADYGFYVVARMLRQYVGDYPFFLGLDQLAQERNGQRVTTDQLQRA
ncbi:MAG: hypothetical protein QGG40_11390, partial [Myxococcota bacterium]|nr:hypothetical protein [Myxococcota bacterium]